MIRRLGYILLSITLIFLGILGSSYVVNRNRLNDWLKNPKKPGQMVSVDNRRIYANYSGSSSPTVVIFTGLGTSSLEWGKVQNQLSKKTSVLSYDRAGYSWSDEAPSIDNSCKDIRALLNHFNAPEPYVFVGHSLGAYFARFCAKEFATDLKAILFLDPLINPTHPNAKKLPDQLRKVFVDQTESLERAALAARLGFFRFLNMTPYEVPKDLHDDIISNLASYKTARTSLMEYKEIFSKLGGEFPSVKIHVVSHSSSDNLNLLNEYEIDESSAHQIETLWQESSREFLTLSPKSSWRELKEGLFSMHLDQSESIVKEVEYLLK